VDYWQKLKAVNRLEDIIEHGCAMEYKRSRIYILKAAFGPVAESLFMVCQAAKAAVRQTPHVWTLSAKLLLPETCH